jgi:lipoprotein NlpI
LVRCSDSERPVRAAKFRRLTFVHTTLHRLLAANDVLELFQAEDPFEQLWSALHEHGLRPLSNRIVAERPVDIVLRAHAAAL